MDETSYVSLQKTGETTEKRRAKKRRILLADAAVDKLRVYLRQQGKCYVYLRCGDVMGCLRDMQDPHELIPVSLGGKRISENRVGLCRNCHRLAQGRVGGNAIVFLWPGVADGALPNADLPGNVVVTFRRRV